MKSVYSAVRTGSLNTAVCASYLKGYWVSGFRGERITSKLGVQVPEKKDTKFLREFHMYDRLAIELQTV